MRRIATRAHGPSISLPFVTRAPISINDVGWWIGTGVREFTGMPAILGAAATVLPRRPGLVSCLGAWIAQASAWLMGGLEENVCG